MCENQCSLGSAPVGQVSVRVIVSDPSGHLAWLAGSIERQFNDLLQLRAGWDGRKALPSTYAALLRATELLGSFGEGLVPPQVFPLPDGGVQLEWHAASSVEIEVDRRGEAHVVVVDDSGEIVVNRELQRESAADLDGVQQFLSLIATRLLGEQWAELPRRLSVRNRDALR